MRFLSFSGGQTVSEAVSRIIPKLLTYDLQVMLTFSGVNMVQRVTAEIGVAPPSAQIGFKHCLLDVVKPYIFNTFFKLHIMY